MQVFMVGCKISLVKKQIVVYLKKNKLTFLLNCSLRHSPRGGGGLKALADMFAKHVNFFWDGYPRSPMGVHQNLFIVHKGATRKNILLRVGLGGPNN